MTSEFIRRVPAACRTALHKLCHALDVLKVLWSQVVILHRNRELLLQKGHKVQDSKRIDDAALQ